MKVTKFYLIIALITFGIGVLSVSLWIVKPITAQNSLVKLKEIESVSVNESNNHFENLIPVKQPKAKQLKLKQINPDGWFHLLFPPITENIGRPADVLGGFVGSETIGLSWNYWTYASTPNWLRDAKSHYSKLPHLACPKNPVSRTIVDGKRAIIQKCFNKNATDGFYYEYYLTFPKAKVYDGQFREYGVFNLSVFYKNPRHLRIAEKIAQSLKLGKLAGKIIYP